MQRYYFFIEKLYRICTHYPKGFVQGFARRIGQDTFFTYQSGDLCYGVLLIATRSAFVKKKSLKQTQGEAILKRKMPLKQQV
ncbi:hypothetical protein EZS27_029936 [termite gut metagenome]|uniref:Uncharacterized protein n=1 Tax=termite gut metagenome TaxID=433724 RepID=A0A5J4QEU7_9ZZZZ